MGARWGARGGAPWRQGGKRGLGAADTVGKGCCHARGVLEQQTCFYPLGPSVHCGADETQVCLIATVQGFSPSDLDLLKKVPIKLGGGRATLPLSDLLPAACVADLERICDDFARQ